MSPSAHCEGCGVTGNPIRHRPECPDPVWCPECGDTPHAVECSWYKPGGTPMTARPTPDLAALLAAADHEAICKGGPCAAPTHHRHVAEVLLATPSGQRMLDMAAAPSVERLARALHEADHGPECRCRFQLGASYSVRAAKVRAALGQPVPLDCAGCGKPMAEHHGGEDPDVPSWRRECPVAARAAIEAPE